MLNASLGQQVPDGGTMGQTGRPRTVTGSLGRWHVASVGDSSRLRTKSFVYRL